MALNWKRFGRDIRKKRIDIGLPVREAAARVGINHATFSRAERGLPVNAEYFLVLSSNFLDTDPRVYQK